LYKCKDKWLPDKNSSFISVRFIPYPMNNAIIRHPTGNIMLLTRKSVASNIVSPMILKLDKLLDDKADGIPAINTKAPASQVTFLRECFFFAVKADVIISNILKDEVNTANKNNKKNKLKNKAPNGICAKASGKTTNNKPGPSAGSSPNENTTGKIANPAKSETKIFIIDTVKADDGKLTSLFK